MDIDRQSEPGQPNAVRLTYNRLRQRLGEVAMPIDPLFLDKPPGAEPEQL